MLFLYVIEKDISYQLLLQDIIDVKLLGKELPICIDEALEQNTNC